MNISARIKAENYGAEKEGSLWREQLEKDVSWISFQRRRNEEKSRNSYILEELSTLDPVLERESRSRIFMVRNG